MKKLILLTLSGLFLLTALTSYAQEASQTPPCEQAYRLKSAKEIERRQQAVEYGFYLYVYGSLAGMVSGQLPVTLATIITGLPLNMWGNMSTGASTKTVELLEEESKQMNRFVKSLKTNVSEAITREDVVLVLQQELDNGNLCANYPKLWSHSKIKAHIAKELKVRFREQ
jgi:hypothetical protein